MKTISVTLLTGLFLIFISCASEKKIISGEDLTGDKAIILGIVEYDYSELENKNIKGIQIFINSEKEHQEFDLSKKMLPKSEYNKFDFINFIGDYGEYNLIYNFNSMTRETENLKSLMNMYSFPNVNNSKTFIEKYSIKSGKIINIGRIVVKYTDGKANDGKIVYNFSFKTIWEDTIALQAFKLEYPGIYDQYKNQVYSFKSELQNNIEFLINNLPQEKSRILLDFINKYPEKSTYVFANLNDNTKSDYLTKLQTLSNEDFSNLFKVEQ